MKNNLLLVLIGIILFSFTFVSAGFGYGNPNLPKLEDPNITFINFSILNHSNSTDYWITDEGNKKNVVDILFDELTWAFADTWNSIVSNEFAFNESLLNDTIDNKIAALNIEYNATSIVNVTGIVDDGNLSSTFLCSNGDTYNVSEVIGANGLQIQVNFTDVLAFNLLHFTGQYIGGSGHTIKLEFWNPTGSNWEKVNGEITDQADLTSTTINIFDGNTFIDNGNVSFRFFHDENGIPSHDYILDCIHLTQQTGISFGGDHDALTGRDECLTNHPNALCVNGSLRNALNINITDYLIVGTNLSVDTNTLFVDSTTNKVGIGINPPDLAKLSISGVDSSLVNTGSDISFFTDADDYSIFNMLAFEHDSMHLSFDASLDGSLWKSSDAGSNFRIFKNADKLQIAYDSGIAQGGSIVWNTGLVMDTSGNVGINTATPQNTLNILGDINFTGLIYGNGSQLTDITLSESDPLWTGNWTNVAFINKANVFGNFNQTFDTNTLFIDSESDRVGINTLSPIAPLHVKGDIRLERVDDVNSQTSLFQGAQGEFTVNLVVGTDTNAFMDIRTESNSWGIVIRESDGIGTSTYANMYVMNGTTDYLNIVMNSATTTAGLVLTEDENVGIGTFTPQNKLNVIGDGNFTGNLLVTQNLTVDGIINATGGIQTDNVVLKTKVIEIGDWNMNTSVDFLFVPMGVDYEDIRDVDVMIRCDDSPDPCGVGVSRVFPIEHDYNNQEGGSWYGDSTNIVLLRTDNDLNGFFDNAIFNQTSYNRGWITITYEA